MTTLAIGSSVTVAVRDGGTVAISTNGGLASAVVTPTEGGSSSVSFGPLPERRILGPYKEGASVTITNSSAGSLDYDVETTFDPSSVAITGGTIDGNTLATQKLRKWRAAVARARTGGAPAKLALIGDSTTRGMGANGAVFGSNLAAKAYPSVLAAALTKTLLPAQNNSFFGNGASTLTADDTRVTMTGGWAAGGILGVGASVITTSATGVLTFTPTANCKTFDIYYLQGGGLGSFNIDVGGVGTTLVNTAGTSQIKKATIVAGSSSLAPLNITWVSGACFVQGVEGRDPADLISVWNMGWAASKAADWNNAANATFGPQFTLSQYLPDLTIICLTINDGSAATISPTYQSDLQALITQASITGDVALMIGVPSNTATASAANQATCLAVNQALSVSNGIPLIDLSYRWGSYAVSNPLGMYFDNVHPTAQGYADVAGAVQRMVGFL